MLHTIGISFVVLGFLVDVFELILKLYHVFIKHKTFSRTVMSIIFYLIGIILLAISGLNVMLSVTSFVLLVVFSIAFQHYMSYLFAICYNVIKGRNIFDFRPPWEENNKNRNEDVMPPINQV